jgi:DNA-binding NarL/FixJ family response regulator
MARENSPLTGKKLSPRENELCRLIAAGRANEEIAFDLGLSENSVRQYVSHAMEKTNTQNRTALVMRWLQDQAGA